MIISTRTRYGTRAMVELASAYPEQAVSIKEIAKKQRLSPKYLEQIMAPLKAMGLVKSVRGKYGGYKISKPPEEIELVEIFHILEGTPLVVECVENEKTCPAADICPTKDIWVEIKKSIEEILKGTTLQDLVNKKCEKEAAAGSMYTI